MRAYSQARLEEENIDLAAKQIREVTIKKVISFEIENNLAAAGNQKTVFVNFSRDGRSRNVAIKAGETRSFSPGNDNFLYDTNIFIYAEEAASNIVIIKNVATGNEVF
jgi:hypothetical protein